MTVLKQPTFFSVLVDRPFTIIASRIFTLLMNVISSILIVRHLGIEVRGHLGAALALFFGLPLIVSFGSHYYVREAFFSKSHLSILLTIRRLCWFLIPVNIGIGLTSVLTIFDSFQLLDKFMIVIGSASSIFTILTLSVQSSFVMQSSYIRVAQSMLFPSFISTVLILISFLFGFMNFSTVLASNIIAVTVTGLWSNFAIRIPSSTSRVSLRYLLSRSRHNGMGIILDFNNNKLDEVLIYQFFGPIYGGLYSIAVSFVRAPLVVGYSLSTKFLREATINIKNSLEFNIIQILRTIVFWSMASSVFIAIASPLLISVLYGPQAYGAIEIALTLSAVSGMLVISTFMSTLLVSLGKGMKYTLANVLGTMVFLLVGILFKVFNLEHIGFISTLISSLVSTLVLWTFNNFPYSQVSPKLSEIPLYFRGMIKAKD